MTEQKRRLLWHGAALFLIGLLTGLIEQRFTNVRMALAAHLEGVMNGTFLLVVGAIWSEIRLSSRPQAVAYWTLLAGTYGNWAVTSLAAILGTAALSPITAVGHNAEPWKETFITTGFVLIGITIIIAVILLMWGLRSTAKSE